jgi:hypothetical protein
MTIENEVLRDNLLAWKKSPATGLQDYSADPIIQLRVGRMLASFEVTASSHAKRKLVVNSVQSRRQDGL